MAIVQPDPGLAFRAEVEKRVSEFRAATINRLVDEYRAELEKVAAGFAIDVQRYYDLKEMQDHVEVVLKLPRARV